MPGVTVPGRTTGFGPRDEFARLGKDQPTEFGRADGTAGTARQQRPAQFALERPHSRYPVIGAQVQTGSGDQSGALVSKTKMVISGNVASRFANSSRLGAGFDGGTPGKWGHGNE